MTLCVCRKCGKAEVREQDTARAKCFVNAAGKRWDGRLCPACLTIKQRGFRQKYRAEGRYKNTLTANEGAIENPPKLRACRKCQTPNVNYFYCHACYTDMRSRGGIALAAAEMMAVHGGSDYL